MPAIQKTIIAFAGLALLVNLQCGCSREEAETYPVSGVLTLDGKPIEGASVMLQPVAGGIYGYGVSGADGSFIISTSEVGDGASPGEHRIIVTMQGSTLFPSDEPEVDSDVEGQGAQNSDRVQAVIPTRYSDAETSGLSVLVEADLEPLRLNLESSDR